MKVDSMISANRRHWVKVLGLWAVLAGWPAAASDESHPVIDSVAIVNENVFDLSDPKYDNFLFRLADHLHLTTRPSIIRRELLLIRGDRYDPDLAQESARNLRQLTFLFKVEITMTGGDRGENILRVNTSDKWTTIAKASLYRSGRRDNYQIGVEESNGFGRGIFMTHDYFFLEKDRGFYQARLSDRRFFGSGLALDLFYADDPRAGRVSLGVSRPYYRLSQKWSAAISYERLLDRTDYYFDEILTARDRTRNQAAQGSLYYRIGPDDIKYYFMLNYGWRQSIWRGRSFENAEMIPPESFVNRLPEIGVDSVIQSLQVGLRLQQINYVPYVRLNRFHKPEDVNLGWDVTLSAGRAFVRHSESYHLISFEPQYTTSAGPALATIGFSGQWWLGDRVVLGRRLNAYAKSYVRFHENHTLAAMVSYWSERLRQAALTIYLDEDHGLRGVPLHYRGGEDRIVANMEERFFSDWEVLSVGLGAVLFADIGNIWNRNTALVLDKFDTSVGGGLRLGVSRSTKGEVVRIDVAYALKHGRWQFSMGTGQFF